MGSPLHSPHGRVAVGAVIGAMTAAVFAVGVVTGDGRGQTPQERAAVEPVLPGQQQRPADAPVTSSASRTESSSAASSSTTTTDSSSSSTTTTTTSKAADAPPPPPTEEEPPPPPPPATTPNDPPTTTTRCTSLICVG